MDNTVFFNNENIPVVTHHDQDGDNDSDYNHYNTSNTSR